MPYRKHYLAATLLFITGSALSAPIGGVVASGQGTISQSGTTTTIDQTSNFLGTRFDSFNVGRSENVVVNQPTDTSILLVKVRNGGQTHIDGALSANGRVFLENPAGIRFGANAVVNVGGLLASASKGDVENLGHITGTRDIWLRGKNVINIGRIEATGAAIILGKGGLSIGYNYNYNYGEEDPDYLPIDQEFYTEKVVISGALIVNLHNWPAATVKDEHGAIYPTPQGKGHINIQGAGGVEFQTGAHVQYGYDFNVQASEGIEVAEGVRIETDGTDSSLTFYARNISLASPLDAYYISLLADKIALDENALAGNDRGRAGDGKNQLSRDGDARQPLVLLAGTKLVLKGRGGLKGLVEELKEKEAAAVATAGTEGQTELKQYNKIKKVGKEIVGKDVARMIGQLVFTANKLIRGGCKKVKTLAGVAC